MSILLEFVISRYSFFYHLYVLSDQIALLSIQPQSDMNNYVVYDGFFPQGGEKYEIDVLDIYYLIINLLTSFVDR